MTEQPAAWPEVWLTRPNPMASPDALFAQPPSSAISEVGGETCRYLPASQIESDQHLRAVVEGLVEAGERSERYGLEVADA